MTDLKPCPFCGGVDIREHLNSWDEAHFRCQACGSTAPLTIWNTRPAEDLLNAKLEIKKRIIRKYTDMYITEHLGPVAAILNEARCQLQDEVVE